MDLLLINNVAPPTPSTYSVGVMDLSNAERNANGNIIIERIATKQKIELTWSYLSAAQLAQVLSMVSPVFFTVTYIDPVTNAPRTGTFYAGDRNAGMIDFRGGVARYKDVKFNLIER